MVKEIECPNCKNKKGNMFYCIVCGKKLLDFRRFEIRFAIHDTNKNKEYSFSEIYNLLTNNVDGYICNLKIEEVEPIEE